MRFYINEIKTADAYNDRKIGLFTSNEWSGTGNIFYEHKTDYYRSTTLLAYGLQLGAKNTAYDAHAEFTGGVFTTDPIPNVSIQIVDKRYESSFEADDIQTAIEIFKKQAY